VRNILPRITQELSLASRTWQAREKQQSDQCESKHHEII